MNEIIELRIARFLIRLPREELKPPADNEDLHKFWAALRWNNQAVATCYQSRALKANNPIAHWRQDKLGKLYHDFIWRSVDVYETMWGLVQMGFEYAAEEFDRSHLNLPPATAYDLFMQIVGTERDNEFRIALRYYKISVQESFTLWELIRKAAWSGLSQKEYKKLKHLTSRDLRNGWLEYAYAIWQNKAKTDSLIADKLQDFRRQVGRLADAHLALISNARKGRVPLKLQSYEWRDLQQHFANRYGGSYGA